MAMSTAGAMAASELQVDDLAHPQTANGHEDDGSDDHDPAQQMGKHDVHVAGINQHQHQHNPDRHGHEDVGREFAFSGEGFDVPLDLAALADGLVDLVQDFGQVAAYFAVDLDGLGDPGEVLVPHPVRGVAEGGQEVPA